MGDNAAALDYHKKFMAADKAYLDDVSARQLAFQMAQHQAVASKLQIETLNQQNQVLKLKEELAAKAVQNSRLSIALLLAFLAFIALWAYKTKRSQMHFMRQAQHDGLTGIFIRHHFMRLAETALESVRRTNGTASVVIIDLDHFKIINDAHGHAAGDTVLKLAVAACRGILGHGDIFGRLGGEEFGLFLPDRDVADAAALADRCRLAIAATDTGDGRDEFPITASFGVTSTSISGYTLQQMLANADSALYQAKRRGRNRVEIFKSSPVQPGPDAKQLNPAH
jgi:diguanylate cyclase (GGDEF)-like protein